MQGERAIESLQLVPLDACCRHLECSDTQRATLASPRLSSSDLLPMRSSSPLDVPLLDGSGAPSLSPAFDDSSSRDDGPEPLSTGERIWMCLATATIVLLATVASLIAFDV